MGGGNKGVGGRAGRELRHRKLDSRGWRKRMEAGIEKKGGMRNASFTGAKSPKDLLMSGGTISPLLSSQDLTQF